jgi:hypothetical protein
LYRPVNTILINSRLAPGLGIAIENPQFVPHYQGIHTVTDDNGVSTGERVSTGQNWEANYAGRNETSNDFAFGTLLLDVVVKGTDGTKSIRVGNLYMAPPSYMTERGRSWQASLTQASANTKDDQPILVMGDGNTYGMNSAMEGPLHTASYPLSAGVAALTRADIDENDHWTNIAKRKGFTMDKSSETDPTIEKAGGLVGMRLDHFAAKGVRDYKIDLTKVLFSDHNLLTARVVL